MMPKTPKKISPYSTPLDGQQQQNRSWTQKIRNAFSRLPGPNALPFLQRKSSPMDNVPMLSIGITTFVHRFEDYFIPLISKIREFDQETEIVVAINGEHQQPFDEAFRGKILHFLADHPRVFPIVFPEFRGVSKLWNSIITHASHEFILMLGDDIMITDPDFLATTKQHIIQNQGKSFTINKSFAHFVLSRKEIDQLGYFDERLLGIGEEDGDITWRYHQEFRQEFANFKIKSFKNFSDHSVRTYKPTNIQCHSGTKYSLFNRNLMERKYQPDPQGFCGMFEQPVRLIDPGPEQYPNERFYRKNRDKL